MSQPLSFLSDLVVLDLSQYIPGPMSTLFLADMGARIVKIEPPGGDPMKALGPRDRDGRAVYYEVLNAGKHILRIDLKSAAGKARFLDLVSGADIIVEGFRAGVMERLGLGFDVLQTYRPDVILCSIGGYADGTGLQRHAGHDGNYLALSGAMHRNGLGPGYYDPPLGDSAGSLFAATAILAALHGRARSGGCHIEIALADTVMPLQMMQVAGYHATGSVPATGSSYLNGGAAYYNTYAVLDGRVMLGALEKKFWRSFCIAAGRPDWIGRHDEELPQGALRQEVADFFSGRTRADCQPLFDDPNCCLSPVLALNEALDHAYTTERALVSVGPDGLMQVGFPARFNEAQCPLRPPGVAIDDQAGRHEDRPDASRLIPDADEARHATE